MADEPNPSLSGPPTLRSPVVARPPTPKPFDPLVGATLVGRYQILRRIGEGGMSAVYEARHTVLHKPVAVKVLLEKFLERTELVARLLQEARLASAIGHEHIIDVMDFGTTSDGRSFVVMELLEGESLAQMIAREAPLPIERCLYLTRQIVSALGAAHDKGIVHRDVKPENVFILRRGEQDFVKVMDFGISKAVQSREEGVEMVRLTRTGMVLGTPLYMSPEQARGEEDVDVRADVWAVGVVMYECLTGEVPFRAKNYLAVISQVLNEDVEMPSQLRPELAIPVSVEAVVMRAMAKDRTTRYQRMSDLERDLDRLVAGDPNVGFAGSDPAVAIASPLRGTGARWPLGLSALAVVAIGLFLGLASPRPERPKPGKAGAPAAGTFGDTPVPRAAFVSPQTPSSALIPPSARPLPRGAGALPAAGRPRKVDPSVHAEEPVAPSDPAPSLSDKKLDVTPTIADFEAAKKRAATKKTNLPAVP